MNNLDKNCMDFIFDTLGNRPRDLKERFINYNNKDKEILKKLISEHKETLENNREELSIGCYNDLNGIYEWLNLLLDNNII